MTGKEFLKMIENIKVDENKSGKIEAVYGDSLPDILKKLLSNASEPVFLDDDSRVMSYDEIIDAEKELHVAFKDKGFIPFVDCGDNDFIVFHLKDKIWSKFNIVDETIFKKKDNLEDLLK